ncbi:hypothetical protein HBH56_070350 [Parastagonospora nodorum]|uniref:BTB domain-containing protein n=2 Tax=Phaeosphaeria nodorum (strain SN15 / ATCC MYA-4574 / FGSC 10173) TaxID=321614 RepID=A0A7U2HYS7_PHANO|nr:hypothetical protein HBH56_070350 [Parastagonospora nodorum]QRC93661.1 hypothetical protein JI435_038690 [Parastagonospora nodorum SN15]KAH3932635.1 hypothetical protein HBH54_077760 [Parastagonospora nodorum]KAH4143395.1 hypothetical protein HBH45_032790 [Parastagonospora nodorum]KAH4165846.1 hypothetical protein HBH44_070580 [Parastagonospora nodorum]
MAKKKKAAAARLRIEEQAPLNALQDAQEPSTTEECCGFGTGLDKPSLPEVLTSPGTEDDPGPSTTGLGIAPVEPSPSEALENLETSPENSRKSPYVEAPVQLLIGQDETVFYVPRHLLPQDWSDTGEEKQFSLPDVNNETGHTLVHYLYTKSYETLATESSACSKFGQALLVYIMTDKYRLPLELEELSICEIENHGSQLTFFETLAEIEGHFSKLDENSRIHAYLLKRAREAFESNHAIFKTEAFIESIGGAELHKFMMACVIELYHEKVSCMIDTETELKQRLVQHNGLVQGESVEDDVLEQSVNDQEHSTTQHDTLSSDDFCTISCPSSGCPVDVSLDETVSTEQYSVPDVSIPELPVEVAIEAPIQDPELDAPRLGAEDGAASAVMPDPEPVPAIDPFAGLSKMRRKKLENKLRREAAAKAFEDERLHTEAEECFASDASVPELSIDAVIPDPKNVYVDDPFAGFTKSQRERQTQIIDEAVTKAIEEAVIKAIKRERLRVEA